PKKYGLRQTIADTLGVGGVMRALRTVPVLLDIADDVAELCPDATWLQYVNPMAMNMMAIAARHPGLKAVGLCHSVQGTAAMLARDLGEKPEDVDFDCAGINHVAFYTRFEKKGSGEDLYPRLREVAKQVVGGERTSTRTEEPMDHGKNMPEKVRYEMLLRLGHFVTESSEHFSEYVPWFIKSHQPELVERFGIPLDDYIDRCEYATTKWQNIAAKMDEEKLPAERSDEYASHIALALAGGAPAVFNGNVANRDLLIPNLPASACVEVPCDVDAKGIRPRKVAALPAHLAAVMQTNINVQELAVKAILEGRREHVYHAVMLDPHAGAELSLDQIWQMVDEMIAAHGDYIPAALRA
ncbi:MAG: alpha-glucosidase/alpha-galactosidase, partial [Betaproteobacteria bacterium AqS2]|nr:alpha-glucosidase/alpha-galactosidase [Betaproteobacteria bacterium AqS2]